MRAVLPLTCGVFAVGLLGCSIDNPALSAGRFVASGGSAAAATQPGFEYLAIGFDGRSALMALGLRDRLGSPEASQEFWYNAQGEMLVLRGGRLDRVLGMSQEWRRQLSQPPGWSLVESSPSPVAWQRTVDRMPGYRYGQVDQIETRRIEPPEMVIEGVPPSARWYVDQIASLTREGKPWIFEQRFAVLDGRVVYSEQCIAPSVCLTLRPLGQAAK